MLNLAGCPADWVDRPRTLTVFAAASTGPLFRQLEDRFEQLHPNVDLRVELSGSRAACAKVAFQERTADLLVSADAGLIDEMLRPAHAGFNLIFAKTALVLAYSPKSPLAARLSQGEPWQTVLAEPGVAVGIANPTLAPVGYRALLALELNDRLAPPELRTGREISAKLEARHQRPNVSGLLAPLQAGEIDVAFIYRSDARLHHLPHVELDDAINFGDAARKGDYSQVAITLVEAGRYPRRRIAGSPAEYGLTIPNSAEQPDLAAELIALLLSDSGRQLAAANHLQLLRAEALHARGQVPPALAKFTALHTP